MLPALSEHKTLRYGAFLALYVAQGLPEGLLYVAVPAWLAQQGVSAAAIGAYIGIILLPWSFKLINGPIMDRFSFLPMGRRRPWVIAAQSGLVLGLLGLTGITDGATQIGAITLIGFLVNFFGAFQDVAVDGMAIDIIPPDEQAVANGLMWGGKTLGIAASTAVSGTIIADQGLSAGAIAVAVAIAVIMVIPLTLRERPGERIAPWSSGAPSETALDLQLHEWRSILTNLFNAVQTPSSLIFIAATFVALMGYGLYSAALPVMTVQELGWADTDYTQASASIGLIGAAIAMLAAGPFVSRFGLVRSLFVGLIFMAAVHFAMSSAPGLWDERSVVIGYMIAYKAAFVLLSVAIYATAMRLCERKVAATQFALYMAFINLGTSAGAALLGPIEMAFNYAGVIMAMGVIAALGALVFMRVAVPMPESQRV